jgi:putative transposase
MPRIARIVYPGVPYHITQRGNNRQDIFFVDDDREAYLEILGREAARYGLEVLGYCLMTNHVHLVAVPHATESLAKAVGRTDFLYTRYINRLHGRSGHLWQNRFFSCALDEEHLWPALVYVDRNPVRAGLVRQADDWPWSSARVHLGKADAAGLVDRAAWAKRAAGVAVAALLRRDEDAEMLGRLRAAARTGRPLGSDAFLAKLERALGRRLRPGPLGRPKKPRKGARK